MLERLDPLRGWTIHGTDGDIGKIDDFLFDDERWAIRYLVVDAGKLLNGRKAILSPISFDRSNRQSKRFDFNVTMDQVRNAPNIDLTRPLSRRQEAAFANYYAYPVYWGGTNLWGTAEYPRDLVRQSQPVASFDPSRYSEQEQRLKPVSQVLGFHIRALDGEVGHIDDFLVDDDNWKIRYMLADTSNFIGGKWVLVSPDWTRTVDWNGLTINVDMNKDQVKNSPEFDPNRPIARDYETRLHDYYHRPAYWR